MIRRRRVALLLSLSQLLLCSLPSATTVAAPSDDAAAAEPGTRFHVDWPKLVGRHDVTLKSAPPDSYQGLLLGNGDVAVSVSGPPDRLTLHIGNNDLWDFRDTLNAVAAAESSGVLRFDTAPGHRYVVDRRTEQWERMPVANVP
jgi:hypothetical protein